MPAGTTSDDGGDGDGGDDEDKSNQLEIQHKPEKNTIPHFIYFSGLLV